MAGDSRAARPRFTDQPGRCHWCGRACDPRQLSHPSCRADAKADREHRAQLLARAGAALVCIRAGDGPCEGPIQSSHVQARADNGPAHWTVPECRRHHNLRNTEQNGARRGGPRRRWMRGSRMATSKGKTKKTSQGKGKAAPPEAPSGGGSWVGTLLACALLGVGALMMTGHLNWIGRYAIGAAIVAVAAVIVRAWRAHRAEQLVELTVAIAEKARTDPRLLRVRGARRWRAGAPTIGRARYAGHFDDAVGSRARADVEEVIQRRCGPGLTITFDGRRRQVAWRPWRDGDDTGDDPGERVTETLDPDAERLASALRPALKVAKGGQVRSAILERDDQGPRLVEVRYPDEAPDEDDEVRLKAQRKVGAKLGGRWQGEWDTQRNVVVFERRPVMPTFVPHPGLADVPTLGEGKHLSLPFAVDEQNEPVYWDWKVAPHALVAGETNAGKTVVLRTLIYRAALAGVEVHCCDPKRTELASLRTWPNVREVATVVEDMVALVEAVHALMDRRYSEDEAAIGQGRVRPVFQPLLLVVDEAREWIERCNEYWKATRPKGATGTEHPVVELLRSLARTGRTANVHLLVGIQRPDAKQFGGEARDNYRLRVACGSLRPDGARMMFNSADVGTDVPADLPGRLTIQVGSGSGRAREVQGYYSPDAHLPEGEDAEILDRLRPATALFGPRPPRGRRSRGVTFVDPTPVQDPEEDAAGEVGGPATEPVHPARLNRGDRVLRDDEWWTVLATDTDDTDEECTVIEWRDPGGVVHTNTFDDNDWLDRQHVG